MVDIIEGVDISHWQGVKIDWDKMWSSGIRFVYIKHSQGVSYKDDCYLVNRQAAKDKGMLVGAYHFVDAGNAAAQVTLFKTCMGDFDFDLPPALDCERYVGGITNQPIVDSMGMNLTTWMLAKPKLAPFGYPVIYTNAGSGNTIFTSTKMARYPLWVASWNVAVPYLPTVWKNEKYFIWQNRVDDGISHGLPSGQIDHNVWGLKFPFPGTPIPPSDEVSISVYVKELNKTYSGNLAEVTNV